MVVFTTSTVYKGSCCSSQGELPLFSIELILLCSLGSLLSLILYYVYLLFAFCLSCLCQYMTKRGGNR